MAYRLVIGGLEERGVVLRICSLLFMQIIVSVMVAQKMMCTNNVVIIWQCEILTCISVVHVFQGWVKP